MGEEGGLQGQRWDHPGGYAPTPKSLPSLTSSRKKTPGRDRPQAPRCVFGEEPRDTGSSRLRGACSQRRHRAGASWVGRAPPPCPEKHPRPQLAEKPRRGRTRLCSRRGSSSPLGGESKKSWTLVSPHLLRKESEGRIGSRGRAERARRERGRGVEGQGPGPGLPPGPKALLLPNARIPGKCSRPKLCRRHRRAAWQGSSTGWSEVRCASSHRDVGTLKIHAMSPVHYV